MSLTKFVSGNNVEFSNDNRTVYVKPSSNAKCNNPKIEGKWYFEFDIVQRGMSIIIGMGDSKSRTIYPGSSVYSFGYHINDARLYYNNVTWSQGVKYDTGDNLGIGIDIDNKKVTYYKNGEVAFEYNLKTVPEELFIEVGTGGDARTTATLLTTPNEMKYYKNVKDIYKSWDGNDFFLIKQNNEYYTIKPEYYQNNQFQPLTLEGGEQPNENDYENFGFKNINGLLQTYDKLKVLGEKKEDTQQGVLFSFGIGKNVKKINKVENILESLYSSPYSAGDRRELIGIDGSSDLVYFGADKLIDGDKKSYIQTSETRGSWLTFVFPKPVCIQELSWFHSRYSSNHGNWIMQGSNNGEDYVNVSPSFVFYCEDKIYKFHENQQSFTHYKWKQTSSQMSGFEYIYEVEFGIRPNKYYFLVKQGQYFYTVNIEGSLEKTNIHELTQENFENEGFSTKQLTEFLNWENFTKEKDVTLYMWTDNLETEDYSLECDTKPFTPYNKLNDEFEICMATDKETI